MFQLLLLSAIISLATAAHRSAIPTPTPTFVAPAPPGESYTTGYPLCGIAGFTEAIGNYTEIVEQETGSNLKRCLDQCRGNSTCESIAYNPVYTECLFFDRTVEETYLIADNSSSFIHYDLKCNVKK